MENDPIDQPRTPGTPAGPATTPDYVSLREIGVGSYGRVWLVQDRTSGEYCAVKIIYRHLFEDEVPYNKERAGVQRFSDLAKASRTLLRIIHVGLHDEEGYFYYLMELADDRHAGQAISPANYVPRTLKWELEKTGHRERLPAEGCLHIMLSLTAGLEELHNGGLIHRDIKPANIIFVKGEPKLADIGLVTSKDLTRTIVSTPGYFREGEAQSERSDIYGLGKVLYEILTGLDRRDDIDFPRLPEGIRGWPDRQLALGLNGVVSKACSRSPRKRYQSAREMRADLELLKQGKSIGNWLKAALPRLRSPLPTVASVTCLLLLGLAGWQWGWKLRSARWELPSVSRRFADVTKENPWANSLGMEFLPVPGTKVLFSIWDTRVQDFEAFVNATGYQTGNSMWTYDEKQKWGWHGGYNWRYPAHDFLQGSKHPVVGVNWGDAKAFCEWLTKRELKTGGLRKGQSYRLPTDTEWSYAVGIGDREGDGTPMQKNARLKDVYPWGTQWPPPTGAGNFADLTAGKKLIGLGVIKKYNDGYEATSPVGSFGPNQFGLYDMAGNVYQWCEEFTDHKQDRHVVRGSSWQHSDPTNLISSSRGAKGGGSRDVSCGFRCVLAEAGGSPGRAMKRLSE